jgi:hypothetical protein
LAAELEAENQRVRDGVFARQADGIARLLILRKSLLILERRLLRHVWHRRETQ